MEIRALRPSDDRSNFNSGNEDLDRFFRHFAGQNQFRHHISVTYVSVDGSRITGFVTVSSGHLEIEALPEDLRRKFPRYPAPILRLSRMATDLACRGQGYGGALLVHVFKLALDQAKRTGCAGVAVDAKAEAVSFYEKFGFIRLEVTEGDSASRPLPTAMYLPLNDVEVAATK